MIGNVEELTLLENEKEEYQFFLPLQFWFCRNLGIAIPLIALQYHEIKFILEIETYKNLLNDLSDPLADIYPSIPKLDMYVDYIYLDTAERRRIAQEPQEYLIEQLQFLGDSEVTGYSNFSRINFSHPVKEIIWVIQSDNRKGINFTDSDDATGKNPTINATIEVNGTMRFKTRNGDYFNYIHPYKFHTNTPPIGVNVYSFALKPESHQPSGTMNFTKINNSVLLYKVTPEAFNTINPVVKVYAINYNIFRVISGMGGLAFSI